MPDKFSPQQALANSTLLTLADVQLVLAFPRMSSCLLLCWKNENNDKTRGLILEMEVQNFMLPVSTAW